MAAANAASKAGVIKTRKANRAKLYFKCTTMKIAVPTRNGEVDGHFGHCESYTIFTMENNKLKHSETLEAPQECGCKSDIAPMLARMGVKIMLAGNMGMGALHILHACGIQVIRGCSGDVDTLLEAYMKNELTDNGQGCESHEGCHSH
jgi:predicted Fe-Mo cluster-binding NifX family protein